MQNLHETVSGRSTPKDLETLFQMTYLYFTNINKDEKSYNSMVGLIKTSLKNKELSPEMALSDSVKNTLYMHNPRFASIEMKDVENANYDRILQIAKSAQPTLPTSHSQSSVTLTRLPSVRSSSSI